MNSIILPVRLFSSYNFPHRLKRRLGNNDAWTLGHPVNNILLVPLFSSYNFPHRLKRRLGNNDAWTHYHKTKENGNGVDEDDTSDEENDNKAQFKFKPIGPSSTFDFDNQFKNLPKQKINLSRRGVGRKRGKK